MLYELHEESSKHPEILNVEAASVGLGETELQFPKGLGFFKGHIKRRDGS